jgi:hypothetical protein
MEITSTAKLVLTDEEMEETEEYFQDPLVKKELKDKKTTLDDSKSSIADEKFDTYLLQAIEEGLLVLGEPIKNAIFLTLEFEFSIKKIDLPKKVNEFSAIMHKVIGLGAARVESLFITQIISKLGVDVQAPNHEHNLAKWLANEISFPDYVLILRRAYVESEIKR